MLSNTNNNFQMMGLPQQYYPMINMPENQLESMYPECYYMIHPEVENACEKMSMKQGPMYTPDKEHLEVMTDEVYTIVEPKLNETNYENSQGNNRPVIGRNRFLRDLISILLIRNLIGRPSYYGYQSYPGVYGTYPGTYGAYPGSYGVYPRNYDWYPMY